MNKFRNIHTWIVFLWFVALNSFAQNAAKEIRLVRDSYISNPNLSFDVSAYSYKTKTDKNPILISSGNVIKTSKNYYSKFLNFVFIYSENKSLIIDNETKKIDFYEYKNQKQAIKKNLDINIDSLVLGSDSILIRPVKNGVKQFTIFSKNNQIVQTELFIDEKTNFIKRILYYYASSNDDFEIEFDRVEVYYKNIQTKVVLDNVFDFSKYIKKNNSKYQGVGMYQGYKINYFNSKF